MLFWINRFLNNCRKSKVSGPLKADNVLVQRKFLIRNSRVVNFIYLQSLKPIILVKYLLGNYFRSRAVTLIQLNETFFIERLFVFFITLFLRRWYAMFPTVTPDSSGLIWKFHSLTEMLQRNNSPKEDHAASQTKFSNIFYIIKYDGQSRQVLT